MTQDATRDASLRAMTRFGLGPSGPDRTAATGDPRGWVAGQIGRPSPNGAPVLPARAAMRAAERMSLAARERRLARERADARPADALDGSMDNSMDGSMDGSMGASPMTGMSMAGGDGASGKGKGEAKGKAKRPPNPLAEARALAARRAMDGAARTPAPFAERWMAHWSNHLTVRGRGPIGSMLAAPYRAEAIEPNAWGRFADLIAATTLHPAMLEDLDNRFSIGPNSVAGRRQGRGANENLARELLELHTLGADGGYTQGDVSALALTLTGWRLPPVHDREGAERRGGGVVSFFARGHEPGARTLLGRRFAEDDGTGSQTRAVLAHLAAHPSTARNAGRRLAAHFAAPGPGREALAGALAATFRATDGDLSALAATLVAHDAPWRDGPVLTTPYGQVVAWMRLLPGAVPARFAVNAARSLGQPVHAPPSPEGWPEGTEWRSPGGLKTRLDRAHEIGLRGGNRFDPLALAHDALGDALSDETMTALRRAASPAQGLAILAMSPEVLLR